MTDLRFEIRHRIPNFRALWIGANEVLYGCRGRKLLVTQDWGGSFKTIGELPRSRLDWGYSTRLTFRLLRLGCHGMAITREGSLVLVGRKTLYRASPGAPLEPVFRVPRGSRPFNLAVDGEDRIYFGEYFNNAKREPVSIYRSLDDGQTWDVAYTFEAGEIRHVHWIQYDPYRNGLWVTTGDDDDEARIAFTDDAFETLDVLSSGSQAARVVSGIPTPKGLLYGTDTPRERNHLFHLDYRDKSRECLAEVQNSVFHSYRYRHGFVLATTAEPSAVNDSRSAHLWYSRDGVKWHHVAEFTKDRWSMKYFQYGLLYFPAGNTDSEFIIVSPVATEPHDGSCLIGTVAHG